MDIHNDKRTEDDDRKRKVDFGRREREIDTCVLYVCVHVFSADAYLEFAQQFLDIFIDGLVDVIGEILRLLSIGKRKRIRFHSRCQRDRRRENLARLIQCQTRLFVSVKRRFQFLKRRCGFIEVAIEVHIVVGRRWFAVELRSLLFRIETLGDG